MPNWKKVITSGSDAELGSLIAPSITGSLLGTASYAITASYVANAVAFPYTGSAEITGSLTVTGSIDATNRVAASIFMTPKIITEDVTVLDNYNALLLSPVGISGSVSIGTNADLYIFNF